MFHFTSTQILKKLIWGSKVIIVKLFTCNKMKISFMDLMWQYKYKRTDTDILITMVYK